MSTRPPAYVADVSRSVQVPSGRETVVSPPAALLQADGVPGGQRHDVRGRPLGGAAGETDQMLRRGPRREDRRIGPADEAVRTFPAQAQSCADDVHLRRARRIERRSAESREHAPSHVVVDGTAIVRVDERVLPQLGSLVHVRDPPVRTAAGASGPASPTRRAGPAGCTVNRAPSRPCRRSPCPASGGGRSRSPRSRRATMSGFRPHGPPSPRRRGRGRGSRARRPRRGRRPATPRTGSATGTVR